jgi:hypothetical protein
MIQERDIFNMMCQVRIAMTKNYENYARRRTAISLYDGIKNLNNQEKMSKMNW